MIEESIDIYTANESINGLTSEYQFQTCLIWANYLIRRDIMPWPDFSD